MSKATAYGFRSLRLLPQQLKERLSTVLLHISPGCSTAVVSLSHWATTKPRPAPNHQTMDDSEESCPEVSWMCSNSCEYCFWGNRIVYQAKQCRPMYKQCRPMYLKWQQQIAGMAKLYDRASLSWSWVSLPLKSEPGMKNTINVAWLETGHFCLHRFPFTAVETNPFKDLQTVWKAKRKLHMKPMCQYLQTASSQQSQGVPWCQWDQALALL